MTSIDRTKLVELTRALVAEPSENPPGNEQRVADHLTNRLDRSPVPFNVVTTEIESGRPNVVARAGDPDRGTVLLNGHMDVVPADSDEWTGDPYDLREDGERLVGRGVVDMKGALAAKILAAESYLADVDDPGQVVLGFVVDEERNGTGARALVESGLDVDCAIIGEPTDLDVCVAQKGVARYELEVRGRSSHSGRPDKGVNSINGMCRVLERIESFNDRLEETTDHPLLAPETIATTEIECVGSPNTIPNSTTATVDWRFHPGRDTDPEPFTRELGDALDGLTLRGKPIDVRIEPTVFARAAAVDPSHSAVNNLVKAAADVGVSSERTGFNAATDARFFIHDASIPTVLFGPGSIERDAHTVDESVRIDDLIVTAEIYEHALRRLLG